MERTKMKLDEFVDEHCGWPVSLDELADADGLFECAEAFLAAKAQLEIAMDRVNLELG
jgi:hypothetical protein